MPRFCLVLLLGVLSAACARDPLRVENEPRAAAASAQVSADLGATFTLRTGEIAALKDGNLLIAFQGVRSDSRCPVDVNCVWAGNAELFMGAAAEGGKWSWSILNTQLEPRSLIANGHVVEVLGIDPAPRGGIEIPKREYVVQLRISRR